MNKNEQAQTQEQAEVITFDLGAAYAQTPEFGNGYECKATFWGDFSIADTFGVDAIIDTFNRAFSAWKDNVEYLTELVMVLNAKCWYWYEVDGDSGEYSRTYAELYYQAHYYALDHLDGDDARYYWEITD